MIGSTGIFEEGTPKPEELLESAEFRSKNDSFLHSAYMRIPNRNFVKRVPDKKEISIFFVNFSPGYWSCRRQGRGSGVDVEARGHQQ
jgi:hypothetical protein